MRLNRKTKKRVRNEFNRVYKATKASREEQRVSITEQKNYSPTIPYINQGFKTQKHLDAHKTRVINQETLVFDKLKRDEAIAAEIKELQAKVNVRVYRESGKLDNFCHPNLAAGLSFMQGGGNRTRALFSKTGRNTPFKKRYNSKGEIKALKVIRPYNIFLGMIEREIKGVVKTVMGKTTVFNALRLQTIVPQVTIVPKV